MSKPSRRAPLYYHGGVAGLAVGTFILPADEVEGVEGDEWYVTPWRGLCFVTIDLSQAWNNALLCMDHRGAGAVYQVEPIGRLWLDECQTGLNFGCRKASILASRRIPSWLFQVWKANPERFIDELPIPGGLGLG